MKQLSQDSNLGNLTQELPLSTGTLCSLPKYICVDWLMEQIDDWRNTNSEKVNSFIQQISTEFLLCAMHYARLWEDGGRKGGHYLCSPWSLKSGERSQRWPWVFQCEWFRGKMIVPLGGNSGEGVNLEVKRWFWQIVCWVSGTRVKQINKWNCSEGHGDTGLDLKERLMWVMWT